MRQSLQKQMTEQLRPVASLTIPAAIVLIWATLAYMLFHMQVGTLSGIEPDLQKFDQLRSVSVFEAHLPELERNVAIGSLKGLTIDGVTTSEASAAILMAVSRMPSMNGVRLLQTAELPSRNQGSLQF